MYLLLCLICFLSCVMGYVLWVVQHVSRLCVTYSVSCVMRYVLYKMCYAVSSKQHVFSWWRSMSAVSERGAGGEDWRPPAQHWVRTPDIQLAAYFGPDWAVRAGSRAEWRSLLSGWVAHCHFDLGSATPAGTQSGRASVRRRLNSGPCVTRRRRARYGVEQHLLYTCYLVWYLVTARLGDLVI